MREPLLLVTSLFIVARLTTAAFYYFLDNACHLAFQQKRTAFPGFPGQIDPLDTDYLLAVDLTYCKVALKSLYYCVHLIHPSPFGFVQVSFFTCFLPPNPSATVEPQ